VSTSDPKGAALGAVLRRVHLASPDDLPQLARLAGRELGADDTVLYLVDYDQVALIPLNAEESGERSLQIEGTIAGRAFSDITILSLKRREHLTIWAPLLDGTDRLGVLEFRYPGGSVVDDGLLEGCRWVASLIAELVITRSHYGDLIEKTRRRKPMSLSAELQWSQLPPLTFVTSRAAIAGVLAPTDDVAGDSFDYAVNGATAHVAVVDAMGHGLDATLMSAIAIGQLRNSRRRDSSLLDTVVAMDQAIADRFGPDKFVTAIVGFLDTRTGVWTWANCGHPPSLILRGGRVVKTLDLPVNPPLGLLSGDPDVSTERLEPGDRLLLYTDGVTEARNAAGEFFGVDRLVDFVTKHSATGRPAAETLRRLNLAILRHQAGVLQDDATTVLIEWLSDEPLRTRP
jgi:serine phosphatase RsbU (regulator of sigma subunit)